MSNEESANKLMEEADKKLGGSKSFFGSIFGGASSRVDDACELYQRAANMYKMSKKWTAAGEAFKRVANLHLNNANKLDAATNFIDSANCYKKSDPNEAVHCLTKANEIFTDMGRFSIAAKHTQTIAEIYESELCDVEQSMQHYQTAADYYRGEDSNTAANKCLLKVAQYAAQAQRYDRAIAIYEEVAGQCLENSLLKYSAKEYYFKAILCHMCVDAVNAQNALDDYAARYPAFQDSREHKLVKTLIEHLSEQNIDLFTDTVADYDSISRLDAFTTLMLNRAKKSMEQDLK